MATPLFPKEFEDRMKVALGSRWNDFASAHQVLSPTSIRVNPAKPFVTTGQRVPWAQDGLYLNVRPSFTLDPYFHAGCYYVQEASSMFLEQAIRQLTNSTATLRVLDLSAAPGGKSTHLLSLLNPDSLLVSNEVIRSRASILSENIQKWGCDNVIVTNNDPRDFQRLDSFFDIILVDAPCSGEGLFRKDPEAMAQWSTEHVELCAKRQRRILEDVWPALKEGGLIIYSTCTYNRSENEDNLTWLAGHLHAKPVKLEIDPVWNVTETDDYGISGYRFFPQDVMGEGFFLAVMQKTISERGNPQGRPNALTRPTKKQEATLASWIQHADSKFLFSINDLIRFFPSSLVADLETVAKNLYILHAGTAIATAKHDKLVPEHASAMSIHLHKDNFQRILLSMDQAIQFLRKETVPIENESRGYALVEYEGTALGWVNVLHNRLNNLYPSEWRIRMQGR